MSYCMICGVDNRHPECDCVWEEGNLEVEYLGALVQKMKKQKIEQTKRILTVLNEKNELIKEAAQIIGKINSEESQLFLNKPEIKKILNKE